MGNGQSLKEGDACSYCGAKYRELDSRRVQKSNSHESGASDLEAFADILLDVSKAKNAPARSDSFSRSAADDFSGWHRCADTKCSKLCCPSCFNGNFSCVHLSPANLPCHVCTEHNQSWSRLLGQEVEIGAGKVANPQAPRTPEVKSSAEKKVPWSLPQKVRVKVAKRRARLLSDRVRKPKRLGSPSPEPLSRSSRPRSSDENDDDTKSTSSDGESKFWSDQEDACLRKAVEKFGAKQWKEISTHVPNRNHVQCLQRWNYVLRPGLVKGAWSPHEDNMLIQVVKEHKKVRTIINWKDVAKRIQGRSGKQCRERWYFNLDPSIKTGPWTPTEDAILLAKQAEIGNKWAFISSMIEGRTENATKMRFKSLMRAKKRQWKPNEDEIVLRLHSQYGSNWAAIAAELPNRTKNAVMVRYKDLRTRDANASATSSPAISPRLVARKDVTLQPILMRRRSQ